MSERDGGREGSQEDHAYFQAIEATFLRLRGSPLLLSPADWRVARRWRRAGLPLTLVERTLEEFFAARARRGAEGRVNSLRYCAPAVERAAREWRRLTAPAAAGEPEAFDLERRLSALAEALPAGLRGRSRRAAEIRGLRGEPEEIENRLGELDRALVEEASERLGADERAELEEEAALALTHLGGRLSPEELGRIRERLVRRAVRRRAGLPTLSLFSAEARAADG
ncbi:MAG: hypothetical protein R3325_13520 [Thermoanaerobaculia bacterium]|nr:hypothetical protein [Thermoanaerobaculia bacterium]